MSRPLWFVEFLKRIYPSRFFVARSTHVPVIGRMIDRWLFHGDDLMFLPDDRVVRRIPINQSIERPEDMVLPSQVVDHFIERAQFHWVMDFCLCRTAMQCQDYPRDLGCLFLGESAQGINSELGHRVTKEEAREHVRRCREMGLIHFVGRNKLDTVWLGVEPGDRLLTVCNCCPCCCLWRALPYTVREIEKKFTRMPGVTVSVNNRCTGCGLCIQEDVCFVNALRLEGGRVVIDDICKGCGRCVEACPQGAIELTIEDDQYIRRSIERISSVVDVS